MAFCSQVDLERQLGGAQVLRQLADPENTGIPIQANIDNFLDQGAADVRASAEIKHDPEVLANLDVPSQKKLNQVNAAISARYAYVLGGMGHSMPSWVQTTADKADEYLERLSQGKARLGRVAGGVAAAINQPSGLVDPDPNGSGVSITAFRRGFR